MSQFGVLLKRLNISSRELHLVRKIYDFQQQLSMSR